jgi:hypothetical protein
MGAFCMTALTRCFAASALVVVALLPAACSQPVAKPAPISTEKPDAGADGVFSKETFTYKTIGNTAVKADVTGSPETVSGQSSCGSTAGR